MSDPNSQQGGFQWTGAVPLCPECQDALVEMDTRQQANTDARRPFECFVVCPSCDWTSDLIEGVN
jgi:hypothetical protein